MDKLKVTVAMPIKNEEQRIRRCLENLTDFDEVLLLDGNSTDRTVEIASQYPNVRVVPERDPDQPLAPDATGTPDFSAIRNRGIALARNDWIIGCEVDLIMTPEVAQEIAEIVANPQHLIYDMPRKYLFEDGTAADFAIVYTKRHRSVVLFNKRINPVYKRRVHEPVLYDETLTQRGRLRNHYFDLMTETPEELRARHRRYLEAEKVEFLESGGTFGAWAGLMWRHSTRIPIFLWRILICQIKGNVLKLGKPMPWAYEKLKVVYKLNLMWAVTQVYFGERLRRLRRTTEEPSARS